MLLVLAIVILVGSAYCLEKYDDSDWKINCSIIGVILGVIAVFISICIIVINHCGLSAFIAENRTRYDSLVYQYENDIYENDNDLGKRELMVDIQEWNADLAWHKNAQRDFWIGVFIPNIYDEFEFIELGGGAVNDLS